MSSNRPIDCDLSRVDTQPIIPEVDDHPGIIRCDEECDRRKTARSIPPASLTKPGTFVDLAEGIIIDLELAQVEAARYLRKLSDSFSDLHKEALSNPAVYGKLLLAANLLEKSREAIRLLKFNVENAALSLSMTNTDTPQSQREASREIRSSIQALRNETEKTSKELEEVGRRTNEANNRMVPEIHPGATALGSESIGYFEALVSANQEGVVKGTREMAEGCLDTIPVNLDRLIEHVKGEMALFDGRLERVESLRMRTLERPDLLDGVLKYYEQVLGQYEGCLNTTLSLISKMPLSTQYLFLDQLDERALKGLQIQLENTVLRMEALEQGSENAETIVYLTAMLEGVERAIGQHGEAKGKTEELIHGGLYLKAQPLPKNLKAPKTLPEPPDTE